MVKKNSLFWLGTKELIKLKLGSPLSIDVIRKKKGKRNFTNHCFILLNNPFGYQSNYHIKAFAWHFEKKSRMVAIHSNFSTVKSIDSIEIDTFFIYIRFVQFLKGEILKLSKASKREDQKLNLNLIPSTSIRCWIIWLYYFITCSAKQFNAYTIYTTKRDIYAWK